MSGWLPVTVIGAGAVAATGRFLVSSYFAHRPRRNLSWLWAVLTVNVVASFIAGATAGIASGRGLDPALQTLLLTGIAGGVSTFSTFSVDSVQLIMTRRYRAATANVGANLVAGMSAIYLGMLVGSHL